MVQPLLVLIVTIVIISAVVGAIAQFLNKLNEAKAPRPRRPPGPARGDAVRQADRDMDRFLAEIDRLRRKNAEAADPQAQPAQPSSRPAARPDPQPAGRPAALPVARSASTRQADRDRPRARVVAELAEPESAKPRRRAVDTSPMAPPPLPVAPGSLSPSTRVEDLPVATVVTPTSATGAPATRVTRLPQRSRPVPKTDLAQSLTSLLNSGHGVATAVILQEILGPPKCKPKG